MRLISPRVIYRRVCLFQSLGPFVESLYAPWPAFWHDGGDFDLDRTDFVSHDVAFDLAVLISIWTVNGDLFSAQYPIRSLLICFGWFSCSLPFGLMSFSLDV